MNSDLLWPVIGWICLGGKRSNIWYRKFCWVLMLGWPPHLSLSICFLTLFPTTSHSHCQWEHLGPSLWFQRNFILISTVCVFPSLLVSHHCSSFKSQDALRLDSNSQSSCLNLCVLGFGLPCLDWTKYSGGDVCMCVYTCECVCRPEFKLQCLPLLITRCLIILETGFLTYQELAA